MLGVLLAAAVFQPSILADEARTGTCTKLISMSSSGEVEEVWVFVTAKCKSGTNANTSLFLTLCFRSHFLNSLSSGRNEYIRIL